MLLMSNEDRRINRNRSQIASQIARQRIETVCSDTLVTPKIDPPTHELPAAPHDVMASHPVATILLNQ